MNLLKSESLKNLAPALVKAQQSMGAALKDSKNPFFKSKYADLNAVIDACVPELNKAGIAVLQSPGVVFSPDNNTVPVINTILLHESGEFITGQSRVVASKQNDPQAEGSATTYARRYGLQAMATLKAEDDDAEGAMGRKNVITVESNKVSGSGTALSGGTNGTADVSNVVNTLTSKTTTGKATFKPKVKTGTAAKGDDI